MVQVQQLQAPAAHGMQNSAHRTRHTLLRAAPHPAAAAQPALAARTAAAAAQRRPGGSRQRQAVAAPAAAAPAAVEELTIQPVRVIEGHVKLPGSKSLSNRILLLAALAEGTTTVENILVRCLCPCTLAAHAHGSSLELAAYPYCSPTPLLSSTGL